MRSDTWEVAICHDTASRTVVARNVPTEELQDYLTVLAEDFWMDLNRDYSPAEARALARLKDRLGASPVPWTKPPGVMVTRSDSTPEALRAQWESEFYDITKSGAKRRRYKKPQIEKDWEAWVKANKAEQRLLKADAKMGTECRECGARWSVTALKYGLHHECGRGLVA